MSKLETQVVVASIDEIEDMLKEITTKLAATKL